jgi:hypothetical protein
VCWGADLRRREAGAAVPGPGGREARKVGGQGRRPDGDGCLCGALVRVEGAGCDVREYFRSCAGGKKVVRSQIWEKGSPEPKGKKAGVATGLNLDSPIFIMNSYRLIFYFLIGFF